MLHGQVSDCVCTPLLCASLPDNSNFAALNTTTGFCLCLEGAATFESCPAGKQYDPIYKICLKSASASASVDQESSCDATKCQNLLELSTFAAIDKPNGFCLCGADGTATYHPCADGHIFDETLGLCIVDACDPQQCRSRVQFEAFAAKNTTKGFCACDIIPTYYHCTPGHVFDTSLGVCVDEVTATIAACDPRDCRNRIQFQPFAANNDTEGFCSCDGIDETATYHKCAEGKVFDRELGVCLINEHVIQKRSVQPEQKSKINFNV